MINALRRAAMTRNETFIEAWQFGDAPVIDLGFVCKRLHRSRLKDIAGIEALRWRVLLHSRRARLRRTDAIAWLRRLGVAYTHDDYGTTEYLPHEGEESYLHSRVHADSSKHALQQLADIPDINAEHVACGEEIEAAEEWLNTFTRREMCLSTALTAALHASDYIREGVEEAKRAFITINGRVYFVTDTWAVSRASPYPWPRPEDLTIRI